MKYSKEQQDKIHKVMHEFKHGKLKSGSKNGKKVEDRNQAIAIAISEAGLSKSDDTNHEANIEQMIEKSEIVRNFDLLEIENTLKQITFKNPLKKAFDSIFLDHKNYDFVNKSNDNILEKSLDTSKLIKKKVQIHSSNGKVYEGYRWVSQETGQSINTGKESKETEEFKTSKEKESKQSSIENKKEIETKQESEIGDKIKQISESGGSKSKRIRDLVGLGVYDPLFIMQLNPDVNISNVSAYIKEANIDLKKFDDTLESNINVSLGNKKLQENSPIYKLQQELNGKDLSKILKDKKLDRAKTLGITSKDKFDAYKFKLDQVIADRNARSLIAYGTGGIGKTYNLEQKLQEHAKIGFDPELDLQPDEYDYIKITGNTSPNDLYNIMYQNKNKLIIFDDADSMWENADCSNILKGALDSTGDRMIHYGNPKKLQSGEKPANDFKFNGQMIFVSNLPRDKFYQPLVDSRSNAIDLSMNMDQTLEMLDDIKYKFKYKNVDGEDLDISKSDRNDILKVLHELKDDLRVEQVNGRTLGNLAALKIGLTKRGHSDYNEFKKQALISLDLV